jgi:hypothetical protein
MDTILGLIHLENIQDEYAGNRNGDIIINSEKTG